MPAAALRVRSSPGADPRLEGEGVNRFARIAVALVLAAGCGAGLLTLYRHRISRLEAELQASRLRLGFVERASPLFAAATERSTRDLNAALRWYAERFDSLEQAHPGRFGADLVEREIDLLARDKKATPDDLSLRREFLDSVRRAHAPLARAEHAPLATAAVDGLRVDLIELTPFEEAGRQRLRLTLLLWGAPRREVAGATRAGIDLGLRALGLDYFTGPERRPFAGGRAGAPRIVIDNPERWVPSFPPHATVAVWALERLPHRTRVVEAALEADRRSADGAVDTLTFRFSLPASESWCLPEGAPFEGEVRLVPAEPEAAASARPEGP